MPRQNQSRQKIIDAAMGLFSESGYHYASMDDIAGSAGVAKGTLYYNFPTKSALFLVIVRDGLDQMMASIKKEIQDDRSAKQHTEAIIRYHIETYIAYPQLVRIMFKELSGGLNPDVQSEIKGLRQRYSTFIAGLLEHAETNNTVRNSDSELLANALIDLFFSTALFANENPRVSAEEAYQFLKSFLFSGLFKEDLP